MGTDNIICHAYLFGIGVGQDVGESGRLLLEQLPATSTRQSVSQQEQEQEQE